MKDTLRWALLISSYALVVAILSGVAMAAPPCGERKIILQLLEKTLQETIIARGLNVEGHMAELTVSPTGSWTLLATTPMMFTCIITGGKGWEVLSAPGKDA